MAKRGVGWTSWIPGAATVLAIVSCYGTAAAVTLLSLLGISIAIDQRVWAGVIAAFAALAAVSIAMSYRLHRKVGPVALAGLGFVLILWVMSGSYSRILELAGFALLAAATVWDWRARGSRKEAGTGVSWIAAEGLVARLQEKPKPVIVDLRGSDEFAGELGHIQGARNLPLGNLAPRITELAPFKGQEIVLVCRTQMRSAQAVPLLNQAGFDKVTVLRGGMVEWVCRQLPIESSTASLAVQENGK